MEKKQETGKNGARKRKGMKGDGGKRGNERIETVGQWERTEKSRDGKKEVRN